MKFIPLVILAIVLFANGFNPVVASTDTSRTSQVLQIQQLQGLVLNIQLLQKQLETPKTINNKKVIKINRLTLPPVPIKCQMDAKICSDGSVVVRGGPKCQFPACPISPVACSRDVKVCPDGSTVTRTGPKCEFLACPSPSSTVSCPLPPVEVTCLDNEVPMRKPQSTCGYVCSPVLPSTF